MYQVRLEFQNGVRQKVSDTFTASIIYIYSQISGNFVWLILDIAQYEHTNWPYNLDEFMRLKTLPVLKDGSGKIVVFRSALYSLGYFSIPDPEICTIGTLVSHTLHLNKSLPRLFQTSAVLHTVYSIGRSLHNTDLQYILLCGVSIEGRGGGVCIM